MKTKKLSKKLTINKKTIANLVSTEMNGVIGGSPFTDPIICDETLECKTGIVYTCSVVVCP